MSQDRLRRLVDVLVTLQCANEPLTRRELTRRFPEYDTDDPESGRRKFERDKETLRDVGIVVELVDHEGEEAYRLDARASFLPRVTLDAGERALLLALASALAGGDGGDGVVYRRALRFALRKLGASEPEDPTVLIHHPLREDAAKVGPLTEVLCDALLARKSVEVTYRRADGAERVRSVDPYGLFLKRGHWYLCGRDHLSSSIRVFRLSRMVSVRPNAGAPATPDFEVPPDLDLAEHSGLDPLTFAFHDPVEAVVRVDREVDHLARNLWGPPADDDPLLFRFTTTNIEYVVQQVLSFGLRAELLEPELGRRQMTASLQRLLEVHGG